VLRSRRDVLLDSVLGQPAGPVRVDRQDRAPFWADFDAAAPAHLAWGLRAAVLLLHDLLPLLRHGRRLGGLTPVQRDALLGSAAGWPGLGDVVEVTRIVAGLAWFADPRTRAPGELP
jgi:hypothetical protein